MRQRDTPPRAPASALAAVAEQDILGVLRFISTTPTTSGASSTARSGFANGRVFPVSGETLTLGRDLQNNVVLLDPSVSRSQALIERSAYGWTIVNLSPQTSIRIDSILLGPHESADLTPGAKLLLGATLLEWLTPRPRMADYAVASPPVSANEPRMLAPGVTLQFALRERGRRGVWWALAALGVALLIVGAALTLAAAFTAGRQALDLDGAGHVWIAIALPLLPALSVALVVTFIDRYEREPLSLVILAFLWGALIGVPIALFAERAVQSAFSSPTVSGALGLALSAGLVEEGAKGAGLIALFIVLRDQFDNVTDGIIYGLAIGAGFALVENFAYFAVSPTSAFPGLILDRILLGWLGHSTFSALLGAALGYWRESHRRSGFWKAALIGFAAAAALHATFDAIVFAGSRSSATNAPPAAVALLVLFGAYAPLFVAQALLLRMTLSSLGREAEVVRTYLADEVLSGTVTPQEYVAVQDASIRLAVERRLFRDFGFSSYRLGYALHQTIIGLATRSWHVASGDPRKPGARQPEDAYRDRIVVLRSALLARSDAQR